MDKNLIVNDHIEAGAIYWPTLRRLLNIAESKCPNVKWSEGKGWFTRSFRISAPIYVWEALEASLEEAGII